LAKDWLGSIAKGSPQSQRTFGARAVVAVPWANHARCPTSFVGTAISISAASRECLNAAAAEHVVRQTGNLGSNAIQHALESFAIIQKMINSSHMHNYKDPKALTRTDKAQRKAAKKRKTQMLELRKKGHDDIETR